MLRQRLHRLRQHVQPRPGGNIVEDAGPGAGVRDGLKAGDQPPQGRLVVVGGHQQHRVRPQPAGRFCPFHGRGRHIGAGARDHRHAPRRFADGEGDQLLVFPGRKHGTLPRGPGDDQRVHPAGQLEFNQPSEGFIVDSALSERGDQRGPHTPENPFLHGPSSPLPDSSASYPMPPARVKENTNQIRPVFGPEEVRFFIDNPR